jgi:hydrogenase maturation protease
MTGRPLVIGLGNRMRGDDGAGAAIARRLAAEPTVSATIVLHRQLLPEMADTVADAGSVLFIDASRSLAPGRIAVQDLPAVGTDGSPLGHQLSPAGLLALAERLYGRRPPAILLTIGGARFELEEALSPAVTAALPDAVATARRLLEAGKRRTQ